MGLARLAESSIRSIKGKTDGEALSALDKILAASAGGALATWNQPIEGKPHLMATRVSSSRCLEYPQSFESRCSPP